MKPAWVRCQKSLMATLRTIPAVVSHKHGVWPSYFVQYWETLANLKPEQLQYSFFRHLPRHITGHLDEWSRLVIRLTRPYS